MGNRQIGGFRSGFHEAAFLHRHCPGGLDDAQERGGDVVALQGAFGAERLGQFDDRPQGDAGFKRRRPHLFDFHHRLREVRAYGDEGSGGVVASPEPSVSYTTFPGLNA